MVFSSAFLCIMRVIAGC